MTYVYEEIESSILEKRPVELTDKFALLEADSPSGKAYKVTNTAYSFEGEIYYPWIQYQHRYGTEGWFVVGSVTSNNYSSGIVSMFKKENRSDILSHFFIKSGGS